MNVTRAGTLLLGIKRVSKGESAHPDLIKINKG